MIRLYVAAVKGVILPAVGAVQERGQRSAVALQLAGWRVLTVWECSLKARRAGAMSSIAASLSSGVIRPTGTGRPLAGNEHVARRAI